MSQRTFDRLDIETRIDAFLVENAAIVGVLNLLEKDGLPSRFAGGCVRDLFLARPIKDIDVATSATPDQMIAFSRRNNINCVPTGISHGTVSLIIDNTRVEFTTLRRDESTDGRHAVVSFDQVSFKEDGARRDFTINAMFLDSKGKVFDFFGGLDDLAARRLRFVGDPSARIREDYLRILRFFRFLPGFSSDPEVLDVLKTESVNLSKLSRERVRDELFKIFSNDSSVVKLIIDLDVLSSMFVKPTVGVPLFDWFSKASIKFTRYLYWVYILLDSGLREVTTSHGDKDAHKYLHEILRLSSKESDWILYIKKLTDDIQMEVSPQFDYWIQLSDDGEAITKRIFSYGFEWSLLVREFSEFLECYVESENVQKVKLFFEQWLAVETEYGARRQDNLPLTTQIVMDAFSLEPGPFLGQILKKLRFSYVERKWSSQEQGLQWLRELLNP